MSLQWSDIKNLVTANLSRVNDPTVLALLPLWAASFQLKVQHDRNYYFLKATAERTIDDTSQVYELPPGYKDGLNIYLKFTVANGDSNNAFEELFPISDTDVVREYSPISVETDKMQPINYVLGVNSFTLWPWPDKQYTIRTTYWKDIDPPTAASLDNFSNYWMSVYPDLYEQELTMRGMRYLEQWEAATEWGSFAQATLMGLRREHNARVMQSESMMVPRADVKGSNLQERGNSSWTDSFYW